MGTTKRQRDVSDDKTSLAVPTHESERKSGFRAVGVAVSKLAAPIVAKRGGGTLVRLKSEWVAIIGSDLAAMTWPVALGRDGVLKLRTASMVALELQHRAPLVIERINLFFGRCIVTRLALVQGLLPLDSPFNGRGPRPFVAGKSDTVDDRLSEIADPLLRAALARLGRALAGTRG
jgi:hypothetical protein